MYPTLDSVATVMAEDCFAGSQVRVGDLIDVIVTDSLDPDLRTTASASP